MSPFRGIFVVVFVSMMMPGCDCNTHNHDQAISITTLEKDTAGLPTMNEEMKKALEREFLSFQFSLNDTDYRKHLQFYDQRMFRYEGLQLDTVAIKYKKQYNLGQSFEVKNVMVNKISPMVEDSGFYWSTLRVYIKMDIKYEEKYPGDPKGLLGIVRDNFGQNVEYDSLSRAFRVDDNFVFYAVTPVDSVDFHFLKGSYFRVAELSKLAQFKTIATLKRYE
ncbi:MAG: hypothetical protein SGI87_06035 [Flavobacteriales bacterium]|nr:hypothetical protein [Flavobacteriales bacterium]